MSVQCVLLEYMEEEFLFTLSATLLNKRWIIIPAAPLVISISKRKNVPNFIETLETSKIHENNFLSLKTENVKIVMSPEKSKNLQFQLAKYVGIFSCDHIKHTFDFPLGCGENKESHLDYNNLLSLFIIFDTKKAEIFVKEQFVGSISQIIKQSTINLQRGLNICIESAPFGARELLNSYSQGIISNILGKNSIYILTDAPTAPGAEGSPIYAFKQDLKTSLKHPLGIVISSLNWWRGEHTGFTLGVLLIPLLSQLLPKKWSLKNYLFSNKNSVLDLSERSLVQIFCGSGWGTGVLINIKLGIFITGSHVVRTGNTDKITIRWRNKQFPANLIYRTETFPYDLALISTTITNLEKMLPINIAVKPAIKGEKVYAAGYPIFKSLDYIFPILTKGNVSLIEDCMLQTSCCILAGSSGGAILRENGELLGIIVCHTTVDIKDRMVVYPKINMSIPISVVRQYLFDYFKSGDINILKNLESNDTAVQKKWQIFQPKL